MKLYKILHAKEWATLRREGRFQGSEVDAIDGYIHLSTALQVCETAAKHFKGITGLVLVEIDSDQLGDSLRWETARGSQLFPHYFDALSERAVTLSWALPWDGHSHRFPDGFENDIY